MSRIYRLHCRLFDCLLNLQSDELIARYGDEIRIVFHDQLSEAWRNGPPAVLRVWSSVLAETITLATPYFVARLRLLLAATTLASIITVSAAFGFCTLGPTPIVRASSQQATHPPEASSNQPSGNLIPLPDGHNIYLECTGLANATPTVILANGRGLGTADAWTLVQQKLPPSIRACSYDAIGAGRSDHLQIAHPESRPIDQVLTEMHALFEAAHLQQPYILVGASAGGILIRRYQQQHPQQIAGLVFVDSAHEEMEWRNAAIAKQFDPNWNNPAFLDQNGFLPDHQPLTWHADIPLIVLERTERAPCSAFPGLDTQQCNAINDAWHSFQVDLAQRSRYGQLRSVPNSGHFMHQQRPDAIAEAIQDVIAQTKHTSLPPPSPNSPPTP